LHDDDESHRHGLRANRRFVEQLVSVQLATTHSEPNGLIEQ
jgi:hypothetical protein